MNSMFSNCNLLQSIDISNFKTPLLSDIGNMFNGCTSLISVDFSSFNTNKLNNIDKLFQNCINLTYIDISTFPDSLDYNNDIFENIDNSGTIKVNKNISLKIQTIFNDLNMSWIIIDN